MNQCLQRVGVNWDVSTPFGFQLAVTNAEMLCELAIRIRIPEKWLPLDTPTINLSNAHALSFLALPSWQFNM